MMYKYSTNNLEARKEKIAFGTFPLFEITCCFPASAANVLLEAGF